MVLDRDPACTGFMRSSKAVHVVHRTDVEGLPRSANVFVLALASELGEVAEFVRAVNQEHRLRALLVHADVEERWIAQMLDKSNLRTLKNLLVHRGPEVPVRVLGAWRLGAQDALIADAGVVKNSLMVLTCTLERLEVGFPDVPALARLPVEERSQFQIASDGSYLHWRRSDIHLDLEALRIAVDPAARDRALQEKLRHEKRFGEAVATFRKQRGLSQTNMAGVSDRQVRRIEAGEYFPRTETLKNLAAAHGMKLSDYLDAIAGTMRGPSENT
jgi:DNA-binding XRE family transcriptional regulator